MKPDSPCHIAIVNVGDAADPGHLFSGTLHEVLSKLIQHIGATTVAKRFDIALAREKDVVVNRLLTGRATRGKTLEEIDDQIADMLSRGPVESDDPEDNWTPPKLS
mgnify:CR=1 FL=1